MTARFHKPSTWRRGHWAIAIGLLLLLMLLTQSSW